MKQSMNSHPKIAVIGGGSWATAIVKMLCENLDTIGWYMRSASAKEHIIENKHNPNYLSSAELHPEQLELSNDLNKIIDNLRRFNICNPLCFFNPRTFKDDHFP